MSLKAGLLAEAAPTGKAVFENETRSHSFPLQSNTDRESILVETACMRRRLLDCVDLLIVRSISRISGRCTAHAETNSAQSQHTSPPPASVPSIPRASAQCVQWTNRAVVLPSCRACGPASCSPRATCPSSRAPSRTLPAARPASHSESSSSLPASATPNGT